MKYIALDIGSGLTKVMDEHNRISIPSNVGKTDLTSLGYGMKTHEMIIKEGQTWVTGATANATLNDPSLESSTKSTWYQTSAHLILMYSAIAMLYPQGYSGKLALATGLPIQDFDKKVSAFRQKLVGTHDFETVDSKYSITIDAEHLVLSPQVFGLHFINFMRNKNMDLMQGRFGYIDPGTYTLGWVAISDGMYESVISDGRQVGLKKLGEHVQKYLSETYQWSPRSQADILAALTKGKLEVFDKGKLIEIDLYEVSRQFINKIYGEVLNEIDKTWKGARDRRVYVGSGGGRYILELVQEKFPHAVLLSSTAKQRKSLADGYYDFIPNQSDVFDVVHGYLLYGLDQLETELEKANNENKELVA